MSAMTDEQVRAGLERIKKAVDIHVSWLKLQTGDWESHSMGIPVKDIVMLLDRLAESQQALGEIVMIYEADNISFPDALDQIGEIARKHRKGGK